MKYTKQQKQQILSLARLSIETFLNMKRKIDYTQLVGLDDYLLEEKATFVTLEKDGDLRGCIGSLEARRELYVDVIENAYSAAFEDYRFSPVKLKELKNIKIKISILSKPENFEYNSVEDLVDYLDKVKPGVVLSDELGRRATFLPVVWEQLPDPLEFLDNLCVKAGLPKKCWQDCNIQIKTYQVESLGE